MLGALLDPVRTQKKNCLYGVVSGCNSLHGSFLMKFFVRQHQATKGSVSACCSVTWVNPSSG